MLAKQEKIGAITKRRLDFFHNRSAREKQMETGIPLSCPRIIYRDKRNEPSYIIHITEKGAMIKGFSFVRYHG